MSPRRSQVELAKEAEAKVAKARANLELDRIRLRRESIRGRRAILSMHRAAEKNRFTQDWIAPATSGDSETVGDMLLMTSRARQMVRDDAWAKSIVRAFRRNIIGTGITPAIDKKTYKPDWLTWSQDPVQMDLEHRRAFLGIQHWAIAELVTAGEAFVVRWITGKGVNRRLMLQCFEVEQLDRYKIQNGSNHNEIRNGIEVDEHGAPVAYHFYKRHPHDIRGMARPAPMTLESMRVPASMVCHVYDPERVRQTHGVTWLRPVLRKLRDLSEYDAAQLRVARAEASIGLIIKGGDDSVDPLELDGLNVAYVEDNEDVTTFTPSRPGNTYDPFVRAQLKAIAAGVGLSYDQIARDFDKGSFSSKRQGAIEDHREFEPLIAQIITQLCKPVMLDWLDVWALQNTEKSGDYFLTDTPERVNWQGQGWEWVDPEQQGKGVERMMRLGLTTRTREANKLGTSVEELDEEMEKDGTREMIAQMQPDGREVPAPDSPDSVELEPAEVANG